MISMTHQIRAGKIIRRGRHTSSDALYNQRDEILRIGPSAAVRKANIQIVKRTQGRKMNVYHFGVSHEYWVPSSWTTREKIMKVAARSGVGAMMMVEILEVEAASGGSDHERKMNYCIVKGVDAGGEMEDHSRPPHPMSSPMPQSAAVGMRNQRRKYV